MSEFLGGRVRVADAMWLGICVSEFQVVIGCVGTFNVLDAWQSLTFSERF